MNEHYGISIDGDMFSGRHSTREDAIAAVRAAFSPDVFWTARIVRVRLAWGLDATAIIKEMIDNTAPDVGESSEIEAWQALALAAADDLQDRINGAIAAWLAANNLPDTWPDVRDIQRHGEEGK